METNMEMSAQIPLSAQDLLNEIFKNIIEVFSDFNISMGYFEPWTVMLGGDAVLKQSLNNRSKDMVNKAEKKDETIFLDLINFLKDLVKVNNIYASSKVDTIADILKSYQVYVEKFKEESEREQNKLTKENIEVKERNAKIEKENDDLKESLSVIDSQLVSANKSLKDAQGELDVIRRGANKKDEELIEELSSAKRKRDSVLADLDNTRKQLEETRKTLQESQELIRGGTKLSEISIIKAFLYEQKLEAFNSFFVPQYLSDFKFQNKPDSYINEILGRFKETAEGKAFLKKFHEWLASTSYQNSPSIGNLERPPKFLRITQTSTALAPDSPLYGEGTTKSNEEPDNSSGMNFTNEPK